MPRQPETNVCQHCGATFTSLTSILFCGNACYHAARKATTERVCRHCGIVFYKKSQGHHGDPQYCTPKCMGANRNLRIQSPCEQCGKWFEYKRSHNGRFCSVACCNVAQIDSVAVTCDHCGKVFSVYKTREQTARFCSRFCKKHFHGETGIEKDIREALDALRMPYQQEHTIHPYTIDFYLHQYHIAVEADGVYWHHQEHDEQRDAYLREQGIQTIRITDVELRKHRAIDLLISRLGHF